MFEDIFIFLLMSPFFYLLQTDIVPVQVYLYLNPLELKA